MVLDMLEQPGAALVCETQVAASTTQVLGRNLEGMVTRSQDFKTQWKDEFVSVEHLLLALAEDQRFGQNLLKSAGMTSKNLEKVIKEVRGSNRVTDQVC